MSEVFARSELFWGSEFQESLAKKHVVIVGLGGVGSYACESLVRSGISKLTIIDFDEVSTSNINRQLIALQSTVGQKKTVVMASRIKDINPEVKVNVVDAFYSSDLNNEIFGSRNTLGPVDFVVDAIDTMRSKIELLSYCHENKVSVISSLGAGNRLYPERLDIVQLEDIAKGVYSKKCVFTKNVLYQLEAKGISAGIPFVISDEPPRKVEKIQNVERVNGVEFKKISPASVAFVPSVAGLIMSGYVIRSFLNE